MEFTFFVVSPILKFEISVTHIPLDNEWGKSTLPLGHDCPILSSLMNLSWIFLILSLIKLNTKAMFICCVLYFQTDH